MSEQDNLQVVQSAFAAFQRGDIPAVLRNLTEDVDWVIPGTADMPPAGRRHGVSEVAKFFSILNESQDVLQFETRRFLAGGDTVVVLGHYRWRIKATGRIAEADFAHVCTLRDGKLAKFQEYADTAAFAEAYGAKVHALA